MDNMQYSGSFKDRGISHMIQTLNKQKEIKKLICSSGGNAGHAVAVAGGKLGLEVEIFVPSTTLPMMIDKLRLVHANVIVHGDNWNEADEGARRAVAATSGAEYIPPFDNPLIWDGNSSLVDELKEELPTPPEVIVSAVGGGGLLRGLQLGVKRHNWGDDTKLIAVETEGAASFAAARSAGKVVKLPKINTIATSLGALAVIPSVIDEGTMKTESVVVTDKQAVRATEKFLERFEMLVEPSCGAALALFFDPELFHRHLQDRENAVIVVCGGSAVSIKLLEQWKNKLGISN